MKEAFTIVATSVHDIMAARARVRELARQKGLGLTDQARISLATSSLADVLGLGTHRQGQIVINSIDKEEHSGIRVICTAAKDAKRSLTSAQLDVHQLLVDELTIETLPSEDVQVTMIQWSTSRRKA
jgi:anti-sigma regulatory factor (Ser/Thr protein kinase)